jgi:hypothetical protein
MNLKLNAVAALVAGVLSTNAAADLNNGLVTNWSFDDCTAKDFSSNGRDGIGNGLSCEKTLSGQGAKFTRTSESRVQLPYSSGMPTSGTIALQLKVDSAYQYRNYELSTSEQCALIFTTDVGGGDVTYPGSSWFHVCDNGDVSITVSTTKYGSNPAQTLVAKATKFRFGDLHTVSFSFGLGGQVISVDGEVVAKNLQNTQELGAGGTHSSAIDTPTLGEAVPGFWQNNQWDGGFEGVVDSFRIYNRALTEAEVMELYTKIPVEMTYTPPSDPTPIISTMPDPKLEASGVQGCTEAKMGEGTTTNSGVPICNAAVSITLESSGENPIYDMIQEIAKTAKDNRMADAASSAVMLISRLSTHSYFYKTPLVQIGKNSARIEKSILEKLNFVSKGKDFSKIGLSIFADLVIDSTGKALIDQYGRKIGGTAWFLMKEGYAVGHAYYESDGNPAAFPIALLAEQSSLLMTVVQRDIEAFDEAVDATVTAVESKVNGVIIDGEAQLASDYAEYHRASILATSSKTDRDKIITRMKTKQKTFIDDYFKKWGNLYKTTAKKAYTAWTKELAAKTFEETIRRQTEISALIAKADSEDAKGNHANATVDYAEAQRQATLFFGVDAIVSKGLITLTNIDNGGKISSY